MAAPWLTAAATTRSFSRRCIRKQQQHLSSTPCCCFCSAAKRSSKKRRGTKRLLRPTKRDRIRLLEPPKLAPSSSSPPGPILEMPSPSTMNTMAETLERKLAQAQDAVFNFWRANNPDNNNNQTGRRRHRPERTGPIMDGRWWFWNILFMSMPGMMIATYCQFVATPEMHEMLGQLNEEQRARILGVGGTTLEAEEQRVLEIETDDGVHEPQKDVNDEEVISNDDSGDLTLLALKHRLDVLESELSRKDKQLDHLRRYQLERTQQSGIQNRVEDKMIVEWTSQGKKRNSTQEGRHQEQYSDATTSLTERMKEAVIHGIGESLEAQKEALANWGREGINYCRRQVFGEEEESAPSSSSSSSAPLSNSRPGPRNDTESPSEDNERVIKAVKDTVSHVNRAAEAVSSSLSSNSNPQGMAEAAKVAADGAADASRSAQSAADAVTSQIRHKSPRGVLFRQWNKLFRRRDNDRADESTENPKPVDDDDEQ